ncbi:MAG TPA: hypothetical protein VFE84_13570 [Patescibacteria group bacterium]|jgi:Flp pilus assembly protein TadD|nr:hypothetical protein [Patescibacteria group bacterium]
MRTRVIFCLLLMAPALVLAAKAKKSLAGPLASPEHWSTAEPASLTREMASAMRDINPGDSRNLARVGELQLRAGQAAEAEKTFSAALESDRKDDEACRIIAVAYRDKGVWDKSDEWFGKAVALDPGDLDHQVEWAVSYWKRGDHKKAAEMMTKVLGTEPEAERLYYKFGLGISH